MIKIIKLIIFDLDGTLINSLEDLCDATNFALSKNDLPIHNIEKYRYFVGDGIYKLIERSISQEHSSYDKVNKVYEDFIKYYNEHYLDKTKVYDGIFNLIKELKSKGIKIAVASNKADNFVKIIVNKLFEENTFEVVRGHIEGNNKKPSPDIVISILREIGIDNDECIFVGDSNVDIITAKNAKVKSIGCLWGFRDKKELTEAGADYISASPEEILKFIY